MRGAAPPAVPDAVAVSGKSSGSSWLAVICSSSLFDTRPYFLLKLPFERTGVPGLEPGLSVLETDVLTTDTIPLREMMNDECGMMNVKKPAVLNSSFIIPHSSFRFLVSRVAAAAAAELPELQ